MTRDSLTCNNKSLLRGSLALNKYHILPSGKGESAPDSRQAPRRSFFKSDHPASDSGVVGGERTEGERDRGSESEAHASRERHERRG